MIMAHITILGTSHIAQQSVTSIKQAFLKTDPDIVCVELDKNRLHALLTEQKPNYSPAMIAHVGITGYLFAIIGGFLQQKLGRVVNMQPGADMKQAALLAKNNNKQILLLDRDIALTLKRLSQQLTMRERFRLLGDFLFGWARKDSQIKINLNEVPANELVERLVSELKGRYPTFHKVLLEERNAYMARRLAGAVLSHPDKHFLVIIGAGHEQGFREDFENLLKAHNKKQAHVKD